MFALALSRCSAYKMCLVYQVWDKSGSSNPRKGIPATFLIRDILQNDETIAV